MPISQTQLETWSHQGAVQTAKDTHEVIRRGLTNGRVSASGHSYNVYLQGSYKNTTNIRGDSDVDVVVELTDVHTSNTARLTDEEKQRQQENFTPAPYGWQEFRAMFSRIFAGIFPLQRATSPSWSPVGRAVCPPTWWSA